MTPPPLTTSVLTAYTIVSLTAMLCTYTTTTEPGREFTTAYVGLLWPLVAVIITLDTTAQHITNTTQNKRT